MTRKNKRDNSQRGAIAIIVAAMLTMLSAFAALAIDAGFMYTKSRNIQAVADAAVRAGMPSMPAGVTAQNTALAIIAANGTYTTSTAVAAGSLLTVEITQVVPTFFGRMLAVGNKTLTGRAVGEYLGSSTGALLVLGDCATPGGLTLNGSAFDINGDVQSNGDLTFQIGAPQMTTITGAVTENASCPHTVNDPSFITFTQPVAAGGPFADPHAGLNLASFACDRANVVGDLNLSPVDMTDPPPVTNPGPSLPPGTYCATGTINVGAPFINGNVTFVAGGRVILGANNGGVLTAAENGIVAFSLAANGCGGGPDINIGFNNITINGSIYARNGCINGGGANFEINGSMIAREINIAATAGFPNWRINGPVGGGGGGGWRIKS